MGAMIAAVDSPRWRLRCLEGEACDEWHCLLSVDCTTERGVRSRLSQHTDVLEPAARTISKWSSPFAAPATHAT